MIYHLQGALNRAIVDKVIPPVTWLLKLIHCYLCMPLALKEQVLLLASPNSRLDLFPDALVLLCLLSNIIKLGCQCEYLLHLSSFFSLEIFHVATEKFAGGLSGRGGTYILSFLMD